jgi:hypothetical protein
VRVWVWWACGRAGELVRGCTGGCVGGCVDGWVRGCRQPHWWAVLWVKERATCRGDDSGKFGAWLARAVQCAQAACSTGRAVALGACSGQVGRPGQSAPSPMASTQAFLEPPGPLTHPRSAARSHLCKNKTDNTYLRTGAKWAGGTWAEGSIRDLGGQQGSMRQQGRRNAAGTQQGRSRDTTPTPAQPQPQPQRPQPQPPSPAVVSSLLKAERMRRRISCVQGGAGRRRAAEDQRRAWPPPSKPRQAAPSLAVNVRW